MSESASWYYGMDRISCELAEKLEKTAGEWLDEEVVSNFKLEKKEALAYCLLQKLSLTN